MLSVIPMPKKAIEHEGTFTLPERICIKSDFALPLLVGIADFVPESNIVIAMDGRTKKEGYRLVVTPDNIYIGASTEIGAYYAIQTIRKISKFDLGGREVPCCEIDDEPRFSYRGLNLDVSRHFFTVEQIKDLLELMFMEKLNVFHWHLTDDNGWRVEIKKYPLLTEIGSKRTYTQIGGWNSLQLEKKDYGGFFTQDQIKEVVDYAKARGITVVPEIDFPAHCAAAIAAYNNLACREIKSEVFGFFGGDVPEKSDNNKDWNRPLCCGKEETFEFMFGVLDEICELFDSPYIHIGGDEVPKDEWKKCPHCQKAMKDNNLQTEEQLQGWLNNRLNEYLKSKGRKMIGWNEILAADNLDTKDKNLVVQYWTPTRDKNAEKYVNNGGKMIMSNHKSFYFDMPYAKYPLTNTYEYKPENFGVNQNNVSNVLGYEGELWTEWIRDYDRLQMLAFPRVQALSEVAWSPEITHDFKNFKRRLDDFKPTLKALGVNYAVDSIALPKGRIARAKIKKKFFNGGSDLETEMNKNAKLKD